MIIEEIKDPFPGVQVNVYKDGILIAEFSSLEIYASQLVILRRGIIKKRYCDIIDKELSQGLQSVIVLDLPDNPRVSPLKCIIKDLDKNNTKIINNVIINRLEAEHII